MLPTPGKHARVSQLSLVLGATASLAMPTASSAPCLAYATESKRDFHWSPVRLTALGPARPIPTVSGTRTMPLCSTVHSHPTARPSKPVKMIHAFMARRGVWLEQVKFFNKDVL